MELGYNSKVLSAVEVRAINVEITKFLSEKSVPPGVLRDERLMFEALFDKVASEGQKGNAQTLLKHRPELKHLIPKKFKEHVSSGNLINVQNYQLCFEELRAYDKELINIAHAMLRSNPQSSERQRLLELLKGHELRRV
ncbi:MAG: hypothetical protein KGH53_01755 [Candidatus Micrarchaeota archaeon]|nr:hypothetical protein [Candidatus Micrarchaeota archaeon]